MPLNPYYEGEGGHEYIVHSAYEHIVAEYSGLNLAEIQELDYVDWLVLRRDAFITKLKATEEGRKYLNAAWRFEQTKPDRASLRRKYGQKEPPKNE